MLSNVKSHFESRQDFFSKLRRRIHKHPETAFTEFETSALVAEQLSSYGLEIVKGLAGTGIVGILKSGSSQRSIGLRADMDALHIHEETGLDHASNVPGKMHACGHDGHTVMLLAAAEYLSQTKNFDGTVYFIFQPAEENEGGGRVMVEDGLFEKFEIDAVYGMHNFPDMPFGQFAVKPGVMMAGFDRFDVTISGKGGHAAMPHTTIDPILTASQMVSTIQSIVTKELDPLSSAVVTVTRIDAGDTYNVTPEQATLSGTVRFFDDRDQETIETALERIVTHTSQAFGAKASLNYLHGYPPTINTRDEANFARDVLQSVFGDEYVDASPVAKMTSEDFAFMLISKPGCYIWIGAGETGAFLHHPKYDFNDDLIPLGARYWVELAERALPLVRKPT